MSKFIGMNRVCVPLSMDCDLHCRYCYRNAGRIPRIPEFNDLMREFLGQLDPTKTEALVASGGEPLLHFDKVKELFSYAPKGMHLKVMTNGLNLTQEIVDYLNENNVETWVSHDGDSTEWLRGVDILNDPEIYDLVMQINHLTFCCCCTTKNPDPYECYEQIKARVPRHFYFHYNAVFADKYHSYLTEGFDYKRWQRGVLKCEMEQLDWLPRKRNRFYKGTGTNVLPDGTLVGMCEIHHTYGTVLDTRETVIENRHKLGDIQPCENKECAVFQHCHDHGAQKTPHFCEQRKRVIEVRLALEENK